MLSLIIKKTQIFINIHSRLDLLGWNVIYLKVKQSLPPTTWVNENVIGMHFVLTLIRTSNYFSNCKNIKRLFYCSYLLIL